MTLLTMILALIATAVLIYIGPKVPAPFPLVIYIVLVVLWLAALVMLLGFDLGMQVA